VNRICVIIPQYNLSEMTRKCIDLCQKNAGVEHDILVVDDGSEEAFTDKYDPIPGVEVTRLRENQGFTAAVNHGILWCGDRYDYIHLLNNDTEPEQDFLKILFDFMEENPVVGIAGSVRILDTDSPHKYELFGADLIRGYQRMSDGNIPMDVIYTHWVPLCSSLIRMSMIRYIGLLDRRMKIWCSDNDYCIRANFNGYNVALHMKSRVKHAHAVTTKTVQKEKKWSPEEDQRVLIQKMAGTQYAELMRDIPLDVESNTYGKLEFTVYKK